MKKEISETCKYFESGDKMSAYGEPECLKCACYDCKYRKSLFKESHKDCEVADCGNCSPELPLDFAEEYEHIGISKCACKVSENTIIE